MWKKGIYSQRDDIDLFNLRRNSTKVLQDSRKLHWVTRTFIALRTDIMRRIFLRLSIRSIVHGINRS